MLYSRTLLFIHFTYNILYLLIPNLKKKSPYWTCYSTASVSCFGLVFWPQACDILAVRPGIKPVPSGLESEILTAGPPGKSPQTDAFKPLFYTPALAEGKEQRRNQKTCCLYHELTLCAWHSLRCLNISLLIIKMRMRMFTYEAFKRMMKCWKGEITIHVGAKLLHSSLTLCDRMVCNPPCFSVHGILQAKILELLVAISFSRRSSQPRDQPASHSVAYISRQVLYH